MSILGLVVGLLMAGCSLGIPADTTIPPDSVQTDNSWSESPDTTFGFSEPPIPAAGGSGLPESPNSDEEIDCDNAEDLCDSGAFACDDIADYCDIGPDGGELPDDWDWDQ